MSISSFIFTYLKNKLPDINWSIGSTVRELIASPVVSVTEAANIILNEQVNAVSLKTITANPEEYKESIDTIFSELELTQNNATQSSGVVTILTSSDNPSTVLKNTAFYIGDQVVTVSKDVQPMLIPDGTDSAVQLYKIGYKAYSFDVPVGSEGINTYLPVDTILTWDEAPSDIYDIHVSTAISGGRTELSLEEKVQKIQDYIAPIVLSLSDGIAKVLRTNLPDVIVDACYATDNIHNASNYADIIYEDGINKSYVYIKTLKAPGYEYVNVEGSLSENGEYVINLHINGIIDVVEVYNNDTKININQLQINNNNVYCTLKDDNIVSDKFVLKIYRLPDADVVQQFLDGYTLGSPFKIEVKAPTVFNLMLDFKYSGQELAGQDYSSLCEKIQTLNLDKPITDSKLNTILNELGATLEGPCTYTLYTHNGCCYKQQYSTSTYYPTKTTSYAIYLGVTDIHAKYI
jgi:hypothetical protein